jgi:tryptophan synthase alpha chain
MNRNISQAFHQAQARGEAAFIPFMTAGFPDRITFLDILQALNQAGADLIEVGLPFSDPLADGPVIQKSSQMALENGITPAQVLDLIAEARPKLTCPMVVMTYYNPVLRMGLDNFASRAAAAGVSGLIIPDLPPEEADPWLEVAAKRDLDTIFMVAPTTPPDRRRMIAELSRGFLYYVSLTGVTGSGFAVTDQLVTEIRELKQISTAPVAVGFGVSGPAEAKPLAAAADGVIVGSALIRQVLSETDPGRQVALVAELAASIKAALRH